MQSLEFILIEPKSFVTKPRFLICCNCKVLFLVIIHNGKSFGSHGNCDTRLVLLLIGLHEWRFLRNFNFNLRIRFSVWVSSNLIKCFPLPCYIADKRCNHYEYHIYEQRGLCSLLILCMSILFKLNPARSTAFAALVRSTPSAGKINGNGGSCCGFFISFNSSSPLTF